MKLKKWRIPVLIIIALAILAYAGYLGITIYNNGYEKIGNETKAKVMSIIKKSKGEIPNLQTDNCKASWTNEAHNKQKEMMDKFLNSLNILGKSRKGKPGQYIIATFYDNMQVYIPYNEKQFYKRILIETEDGYYVAASNEADAASVVDYMKKQQVLR